MNHLLEEFTEACIMQNADLASLVNEIVFHLGFKAYIFTPGDYSGLTEDWGNYDKHHLRNTKTDPAFTKDPLMQEAIKSWGPIFWDASVYANSERKFASMYRRSIDVGYMHGLACQVRGPSNYYGFFTTVYDGSKRALTANQALLSNAMSVVAPWAARASLTEEPNSKVTEIELTVRETECLEWALFGKTAWETSQILAVNNRTVNFHLQNAMRKLGVHNKHLAARKAISLGLLDLERVYYLDNELVS